MNGTLLKLYLRPSSRTPVKSVESARVELGVGLVDDHAGAGKREVTLLAREAWEAACGALGVELDPGLRRANLLVEGLDLVESRGKQIRIGEVLLQVEGETRPCQLMDDFHLGLKEALDPEWRGGVFCRVLEAGEVRVGDALSLADAPS